MTEINDAGNAYKSQRAVSNDPLLEQEALLENQLDDQQEHKTEGLVQDILGGVKEAPWQIAGGIGDFGNEVWDFLGLNDASAYIESKFPESVRKASEELRGGEVGEDLLPTVEAPETTTGGFIRGASQFLTGFIPLLGPATKVAKASKVAKTATGVEIIGGGLAGAVTDVIGIDPNDPNVANILQGLNPDSQNVILDFLATDENSPESTNRLKNALLGTLIGTAAEPVVRGLAHSISRFKARRLKAKQPMDVDSITQEVKANLGKEGSIIDDFEESALIKEEQEFLKKAEEAQATLARDIKGEPLETLIDSVEKQARVDPKTRKALKSALESGDMVEATKHMDFNLDKINTEDDIKAIINTTTDILNKAGEGKVKVTHKEVKEYAEYLGSSPEAVQSLGKDLENASARILAGRQMMIDSTQRLSQMADIISSGEATNRQMLRFEKALEVHIGLQKTLSGAKSEVARATNAMKIIAKGEDARLAAMDSIILSYGGRDNITHMAGRLKKLAGMSDGQIRISQALKKGKVPRTRDALLEVYIQGLLSNPKTQFINAVGNTAAIAMTVAERKIAETLARVRGEVGGVAKGETSAQLQGLLQGSREGWKIFKEAFISGEPDSVFSKTDYYKPYNKALSAEAWEAKGTIGKAMDYLSTVTNLPGRMLMSADEMFKTINYRSEIYAQAYRKTSRLNLDDAEFSQVFDDLVRAPSNDITMKALETSHLNTFTNQLGKHARGLQQVLERDPTGIAKVFVPFFRTPVNLIKFATARTPGLRRLLSEVRDELVSDDLATRQLAEAKFATGSFIYMTTMGLAMSGNITGAPPADRQLAARLRETGWKPYSIKLGDSYVPFNRFDPIGMMMGASVDMYQVGTAFEMSKDSMTDPEASEAFQEKAASNVTGAIASIWKNLEERHYLHGIANMLNIVAAENDYEREKAMKEMLNVLPPISFYSSFRRGVTKTVDPVRRNVVDHTDMVNEISNRILSTIPGQSVNVNPHFNLIGERSLYPNNEKGMIAKGFDNLVNPFGDVGSTTDTHPLLRAVANLNIDMEGMEGIHSIKNVDLKPEEISYYARVWGSLNKQLTSWVTSKSFTEMPEGSQALELEAELRSNKKDAQQAVVDKFSRIEEDIAKQEREQEEAEQSKITKTSPLFKLDRSN